MTDGGQLGGSQQTSLPQVPDHLKQAILEGRCVAFVGAGVSSNMFGWGELLAALAADDPALTGEVAALLSDNPGAFEYEAAGQLVRNALGDSFEPRMRDLLERREQERAGEIGTRLRHLAEIPFAAVLTTNYDPNYIGRAPAEAYWDVLRGTKRWWRDLTIAALAGPGAARKPRAVKLHGDANGAGDRNRVVLAKEDYRRLLYRDATYGNFLRAVFATKTMLFLGVSFSDAYLNELRSEVLTLLRGNTDTMRDAPEVGYATRPGVPSQSLRTYFRQHEGIELLDYASTGNTDHQGFDDWLRAIHRETAPLYRLRALLEGGHVVWVDPRTDNNTRGVRWLESEHIGATVEHLDDWRPLDETRHAGASLILTHLGYTVPGGPTAHRVLDTVRQWEDRPPVIVFCAYDAEHQDQNRMSALRRGAYELATSWGELFMLIERLFGRRVGTR